MEMETRSREDEVVPVSVRVAVPMIVAPLTETALAVIVVVPGVLPVANPPCKPRGQSTLQAPGHNRRHGWAAGTPGGSLRQVLGGGRRAERSNGDELSRLVSGSDGLARRRDRNRQQLVRRRSGGRRARPSLPL